MTGQACLPDQGVTVVVDFTPASAAADPQGPVEVSCAIGAQASMAAAGEAGGLTYAYSQLWAGFICAVDGVAAETSQACEGSTAASWGIFISTTNGSPGGDPSSSWVFAQVAANDTTNKVEVGSAVLFQISPFSADYTPRTPLIPLTDVPNYEPSNTPAPPSAGHPSSDPDVLASAGWLGRQLAASNGVLGSTFDLGDGPVFFPDWGLTEDALFGLAAAGVGKDQIEATANKIWNSGEDYVGRAGDTTSWKYVAKTALALQVAGLDPTKFPDGGTTRNLLTELRSAMNADGSFGTGDFPLTHALALFALARTEGGVPPASVTWLEDQQCEEGTNKGAYGFSGCNGVDIEGTALAVQALQAAGVSTGDAPIADAASWIVGQQDARGGMPSSVGVLNANSSGLGAQALLGIGQQAPAAKAAGFIGSLSVSCTSLTSGTGFVDDDLGAIAYDESGWVSAATGGIADNVGQWQRASAQAILGLGLPTFADITTAGAAAGLPAAPDCIPPTSTTTTAPTPSHATSAAVTPTTSSHPSAAAPSITLDSSVLTPGSILGVTVSGAPAETTLTVVLHSDPVLLGSMVTTPDGSAHAEFTIPVNTAVGEHTIAVAGPGLSLEAPLTVVAAESTATTSTILATSTTAAPSLAATGAPAATIPMAVGGTGMVLAGAGLLLVGRRMRRHQPARHRL